MKTLKTFLTLACLIALSAPLLAQTTANWSSGAGDNDWNNPLNWDTLDVPGVGTNAVISGGMTPNYNTPMTAPNFAGVDNYGILTVSAAGFNIDALGTLPAYTGEGGSLLQVTAGGVIAATNCTGVTLATGSAIAVEGGSLVISNSSGPIAMGSSESSGANAGVGITNNSGNILFEPQLQWRSRDSRFIMNGGTLNLMSGVAILETGNDVRRPFLINGGTANLGDVAISRTGNGVGAAGLVVSNNATVNVTSFRLGTANSAAGTTIYEGVLTNTGTFTIADRTNAATSGQRRVFFYVRGGTVVSTAASGIVVANQANNNYGAASVLGGFLDINSGTVIAEKLTLVGPDVFTNAHATLTLSGTGAIYLGSGGLVGNVGYSNTTYTMNLNGGTLGATADYSIVGNGTLNGTFTVKAADPADTPHNITHTGVWGGAGGSLVKTGGGVLTLTENNTYSGTTTINEGTLALGESGSISNTTFITVANGATFDFSAATAGFVLGGTKTLAGSGTVSGNFTSDSGSTINPDGTLTFNGSVSQFGGAVTHFDLPATPGPGNDRINISGDLNVSGVNTIEVVGGGAAGSVHTLFQYGGNFHGTLANFTISGASGVLSNDAPTRTISLIIESSLRNPTGVVWLGNSTVNDWDTINRTNWLNVGTGLMDFFVTGDNALFDDTGAANPILNLVGNNAPASLTVGATANYTFGGSGAISGSCGLTKTNTGTLTITSVNTYSGVTTIAGGALEAATLANGGVPSSIGSAAPDSANLVLDGGTLRYTGATVSTDRGATIRALGGTFDVSEGGTALTVGGALTGDGALTKSGAGNLTLSGANNYTNGTVISAGVLQLNNAGGAGTGPITINGTTLAVNGQLVVNNAVEFNGPCNLQLSGVGSGNVALRGAWSGSGTVVATFLTQNAAQTFTIGGDGGSGGGAMDGFSGTLDLGSNTGFCRLNNSSTTVNFGSENAIFDLGTGDMLFSQRNGATTTYLGALLGGPNTRLSGARGDVSGDTTYVIGGKNLDTVFEGTITNGQTSSSSIRPAIITKVGTGKFRLTGSSPYTGATTVEAGTLQVDGSITASAITVNAGTLTGSGFLGGPVAVQYGGTLSPGPSIGQLTISNSLNLGFGSTNLMEINKASGTSDSIVGLTSVFYGGTLVVSNLAGTLSGGEVFKLFDAPPGTYYGVFDYIELPPLPPGLSWDTSSLLVDGTIKVPVPILEFTVIGGDLVISGTNGVPNATYNVLTSPNVAAPLSQWTTNGTYQFDASGGFSFTNAIDPGTPQQYFILAIP